MVAISPSLCSCHVSNQWQWLGITMIDGPRAAVSADDLLAFLAVVRTGRYTTAATSMGVAHTTVARRVETLESALGARVLTRGLGGWEVTALGERVAQSAEQVERAVAALRRPPGALEGVVRLAATDGFSGFIAAPAIAALRRSHPAVSLEIVAATRRAALQRSGVDLEVVVGKPHVHRAERVHLADYALALYASRDYLKTAGVPVTLADLGRHSLVYFIESMLQVDALDDARRHLPPMTDAVTSTNVYVHLDATRAGAGVGLLPAFLADRHPDLVRILPGEFGVVLPYWLVCHPEALRQPTVLAFIAAMRERIAAVQLDLLGARP
ncbi:LysR family transcriptional regulator [Microbacterium sp. NPDC012755]|uniref:LysR family transcriptional regulator n=1 Tax=Microbacterium sp. NPDC012755 TaxID=3364184 RepID=UPI0036B99169